MFRGLFVLAAVVCACLLGFAYYAEYVLYLDPCPLCLVQRYIFFALLAVFLLGVVVGGRGALRYLVGGLAAIVSVIGIGVSGWHIRLQNLPPDQIPDCGPGLDYMLDTMPLSEVLNRLFTASGECAEVVWSLLGVSMPGWSFIWFVLFFVGSVFGMTHAGRRPAVAS